MSETAIFKPNWDDMSPRTRLYGMALTIALCYLMVGRVMNDNQAWVQVHLPLSAASVLVLALSAAESFLYIRRARQRDMELLATRAKEQELTQRLAVQRQATLNEIARTLIDKLDVNHIPPEVLERTAVLFDADAVGTWVMDKSIAGFALKGVHGINEPHTRELEAISRATPCFDQLVAQPRQMVVNDFHTGTAPAFADFCVQEKFTGAVLSPIVRRDELLGVLGAFYRRNAPILQSVCGDMQTVASLLSSAIQAEELYRDLVQVQRIESIGTLTSGIAHDFNNVLAAILGCASYVKQQTDPASPSYRYLEATEASAHRGAALTKQLLSFVRRDAPRLTVVNAAECIEQSLKMLERSFDKSILIQRQFVPDLRPVEVDASQLEQVILNIAVNARDVMSEGGIFTLSGRNIRLDAEDPHRPQLKLPDGDYIVLGFRDTGCGMNEATQKRIFEPFFTTKRPGKGTGLGLSVVLNIVRNFSGEIRVQSAPGKGTLFEIFLPATDKPLPEANPALAKESRGGKECILLAEDEEVIREMAQLSLEAKGYTVLPAEDGACALSIYREHTEKIDLVIADMVMPRMSGTELLAAMRQINPNVRVIVSSGYSHDLEGERMLQHGCLGYLQKPYNPEALCAHVRSVLDSGL